MHRSTSYPDWWGVNGAVLTAQYWMPHWLALGRGPRVGYPCSMRQLYFYKCLKGRGGQSKSNKKYHKEKEQNLVSLNCDDCTGSFSPAVLRFCWKLFLFPIFYFSIQFNHLREHFFVIWFVVCFKLHVCIGYYILLLFKPKIKILTFHCGSSYIFCKNCLIEKLNGCLIIPTEFRISLQHW